MRAHFREVLACLTVLAPADRACTRDSSKLVATEGETAIELEAGHGQPIRATQGRVGRVLAIRVCVLGGLALAVLSGCGSGEASNAGLPDAEMSNPSNEASAERVPGTISVPDVVGLDLPDALAALRAVGLEPMTRHVPGRAALGTVVAQNPSRGSLPVGDPVIIEVANGTDPAADQPGSGSRATEPNEGDADDLGSGASSSETTEHQSSPPSDTSAASEAGKVSLNVIDHGFSWEAWGSDGAPAVSIGSVIQNPTSHLGRAFRVTYDVFDADGNARGSTTEWIRYAPANATMYLGYRMYLDPGTPPASLRVIVENPAPESGTKPPPGTFSNLRYAQDNVFGEWRNPTAVTVDKWRLSCVTYSGGQVTGGAWTTTDLVGPNSPTGFRMGNGTVSGMQVDDIRCFGWEDNGH